MTKTTTAKLTTGRMGSVVASLTKPQTGTQREERTERKEHTELTERHPGGRPRRTNVVTRLHLVVDSEIVQYLEGAWRVHRRPDGSFASGQSAFIEDLIAEHRAKNTK
jgi:hypothetical protein